MNAQTVKLYHYRRKFHGKFSSEENFFNLFRSIGADFHFPFTFSFFPIHHLCYTNRNNIVAIWHLIIPSCRLTRKGGENAQKKSKITWTFSTFFRAIGWGGLRVVSTNHKTNLKGQTAREESSIENIINKADIDYFINADRVPFRHSPACVQHVEKLNSWNCLWNHRFPCGECKRALVYNFIS